MAQSYTPIWDDWLEVTQELNAQEKGRLIDAIVAYKLHGDWQEQIKGNERYVFPSYRVRLDRWSEVSDGRAKAGAYGGKQTQANESKPKQTEANESKSPKVKDKVKVKEEDITTTATAHARETDFGIVNADPVILSVQKHLNELTETHYDELQQYRELLGDELVLHAIDETVGNGVHNWSYASAIMQGYVRDRIKTVAQAKERSERRKQAGKQTGKIVSAQQYTQRHYSEGELEERCEDL